MCTKFRNRVKSLLTCLGKTQLLRVHSISTWNKNQFWILPFDCLNLKMVSANV